jgi:hypothetical protein
MTAELIASRVLSLFEPSAGDWCYLRRNGRMLLALPPHKQGALRALDLYQPQQWKARASVAALRLVAGCGAHRHVLPLLPYAGGSGASGQDFVQPIPFTTGLLLGSPEHTVCRAIASYQTADGWEVAKIAFGANGAVVLSAEADVLRSLGGTTPGVPRLLGLHQGSDSTVLRLPYLTGGKIPLGDFDDALALLDRWVSGLPVRPTTAFPEWPAIVSALEASDAGRAALAQLAELELTPVVRHGDFARWNLLKQANRNLVAIDWEWGHAEGMPGLDLVHYFLQDARLVHKLPALRAIEETRIFLQRPECQRHLMQAGWSDDPLLPIIASLAWKQGAQHQSNADVLKAALSFHR